MVGEQLKKGEGMVDDKSKKALYMDENGVLHTYSAECTHNGCVLGWNQRQKTFDCPCHGSRFSKEGKVIQGPAAIGLKIIQP